MARLDRIFIRAKNSNGKWDSISLADIDDEQFDRWYGQWLRTRMLDGTRLDCIEFLDHLEVPPIEIKEGK